MKNTKVIYINIDCTSANKFEKLVLSKKSGEQGRLPQVNCIKSYIERLLPDEVRSLTNSLPFIQYKKILIIRI